MKGVQPATAIILFAHGSRVEEANERVRALAGRVQNEGGFANVRTAFLEMAEPGLGRAIDEAVRAGARRVVVLPYFLTTGVHLRQDLPELLSRERVAHPEVEFLMTESLEGHPLLASILLERIHEASAARGEAG
ncbi:MAG: CbiX/SirB N-terminal domain-containing protein [Acidobacteriota bacterium]|nr:CbiX/SirB N-terminal domain-containing protein [Acidobacteriota bacterium]